MLGTHRRSALTVLAALLALALVGCGAAGAVSTGTGGTAQATATPAPTATATPLPTVNLPAACHNMNDGPYVQVGDLVASPVTSAFVNNADQIPQGTPNQPLKISTNGQVPDINPSATPIGSSGQGYMMFSICNSSASQTVSLQSVQARVASFTPFSGALAGWNACKDGFYDVNLQLAPSGGCGGSYLANEYMQVTFPSGAGVGDSVAGKVINTGSAQPGDPNPYPALPLSIAPGQVVSLAATVTVPTTPGTYALAFGLGIGSASPVYFATTSPSLYAPITQEWSGQNCTTPAMKAQIPAPAPQGTLYICPPAA